MSINEQQASDGDIPILAEAKGVVQELLGDVDSAVRKIRMLLDFR